MKLGEGARATLVGALAFFVPLCGCERVQQEGVVVTFPGSAVGAEAEILRVQLKDFMEAHPEIRVEQRATPDAADQRHQLYVQWLNAHADDPDILQLDVIWTPEFAAAGWLLPLDEFDPDVADFIPATLAANHWQGRLYAVPWFVDVGMLYWRSDLLDRPPESLEELAVMSKEVLARPGSRQSGLRYGLVWQGARYEGLVTVFVEYLGAFGGAILDAEGSVVVDSTAAVAALSAMRGALDQRLVPEVALTWHEEETRLAFQNGQALFMRNWPYAVALMQGDENSRVRGRFAVVPMPAARPGGNASAALGGSQLAVNARSDHPREAYAVIEFLTRPEQMLERARHTGQYPARRQLYADDELSRAIGMPASLARRIVESAVARPATPVYTELSEILQIHLHRALIGEEEPGRALTVAAHEIRHLFERTGLAAEPGEKVRLDGAA